MLCEPLLLGAILESSWGSRRADDVQQHPQIAEVAGRPDYLVIYEVIAASSNC